MATRVGSRRAASKPRRRSVGTKVPGTTKSHSKKVKGGTRKVKTAAFANSRRSTESSKRVGTIKTKGGLKRKSTTTVTGKRTANGGRTVTKTRRVVRVKNGRKVVRTIKFTNRNGNKTRSETTKVAGKGPRSTTPKRQPKRAGSVKVNAPGQRKGLGAAHPTRPASTKTTRTVGLAKAKAAPKRAKRR